jgi:uncharacterized membrane protein
LRKGRLEAFSDGVIAIIITIMVLELKVPHGDDLESLSALTPVFLSYVLSFIFVGIYWNNHHHLFQIVQRVNGPVLWANMHLLFWLSLIPFAAGWMGDSPLAAWPLAIYGIILVGAGIAYYILTHALLAIHKKDSALAIAIGGDFKGKISVVVYLVAIPFAFVSVWVAIVLYVLVALMWLIPDLRIEKTLAHASDAPEE